MDNELLDLCKLLANDYVKKGTSYRIVAATKQSGYWTLSVVKTTEEEHKEQEEQNDDNK